MKFFLFLFLIFLFLTLEAQVHKDTKLALLQGIWECGFYSGKKETSDENTFKVINGKNCLNLYYSKEDTSISETIIGFQNTIKHSYIDEDEGDIIYMDSLKPDGLYYTEIIDKRDIKSNGTISKFSCIIPSFYECDGDILSIGDSKFLDYTKILQLPIDALRIIYYRGKQDKRNYIQEYLNIRIAIIIEKNIPIYTQPNKITKELLYKDDLVIILGINENWLKINYGTDKNVWIKKTAIEE